MNRKLKLALAALLGFSTACSSVKNAPRQSNDKKNQKRDTVVVRPCEGDPRIIAMYGVRSPVERLKVKVLSVDSLQIPPAKSQVPELDPVIEEPKD